MSMDRIVCNTLKHKPRWVVVGKPCEQLYFSDAQRHDCVRVHTTFKKYALSKQSHFLSGFNDN